MNEKMMSFTYKNIFLLTNKELSQLYFVQVTGLVLETA